MILFFAILGTLLALIPALLFVRNLAFYLPLPHKEKNTISCSVLIPARNEEKNIADALESILRSTDVDLEVVVLDDGSTDRTAEIVRQLTDPRVRLETAQPLPEGWCGKNYASFQLANLATKPFLIFMDADVRVSRSDSLSRLTQSLENGDAALISGVPHELTETPLEKLIIPLIHFILLGFLPLERMRAGTDPRFAAACGQILAVRRNAYLTSGGHSAVPDRIHDAVALTRFMRAQGHKTDLFDATDTFHCRMYQKASEVWNGFAKNAHEGLGSARLIGPATVLLFVGQVLPLILLGFASSILETSLLIFAISLAYLPRLIAVGRFRQAWLGALLHPVGITCLLAIQWFALVQKLRRRPAVWKGRTYSPLSV